MALAFTALFTASAIDVGTLWLRMPLAILAVLCLLVAVFYSAMEQGDETTTLAVKLLMLQDYFGSSSVKDFAQEIQGMTADEINDLASEIEKEKGSKTR